MSDTAALLKLPPSDRQEPTLLLGAHAGSSAVQHPDERSSDGRPNRTGGRCLRLSTRTVDSWPSRARLFATDEANFEEQFRAREQELY
jgi:hypothetical protein